MHTHHRMLLAAASVLLLALMATPEAAVAHSFEAMPNVQQLTVDIEAELQLSVTPSVLKGLSAYVDVMWQGNSNAAEYDWIAAYSPPPTSPAGFLETFPVKYMNLTDLPGAQGNISMWLLHMRAPWQFAYMRGGFETPSVVALSNIVTYDPAQANVPMQIHLARTVDPTEMQVTWVTTNMQKPVVQYYPTAGGAPLYVAANTSTYTRDDMCGGLAATMGWRDPGSIHTGVMTGLKPGVEYSYMVGNFEVWSPVNTFYAAPPPGQDIDFIIFGDHGQAQFDDTIGWEEWVTVEGKVEGDIDQPMSINTAASVTNDLTEGKVDSTALVLVIGDVSYARGRESFWEQHGYLIQPFAQTMPMMTLLGNHEMDWNYTYFDGTDSGGECGVSVEVRFPMPSPPLPEGFSPESMSGKGFKGSPWYSFDQGAVHFVMFSTEHDFTAASAQYAWLEADLAGVNRANTPWVLVSGHRPMYVSSSSAGDTNIGLMFRVALEPLLLKYKVDAFFAGHHHSYQRTCALNNGTCASNSPPSRGAAAPSFGIVHMVTGAAGQWQNVYLAPVSPEWLVFANTQVHGYTRAHVRGRELTLDYVASVDRQIWDSVTIVQQADGSAPVLRRNPSKTYQPEGHVAIALE